MKNLKTNVALLKSGDIKYPYYAFYAGIKSLFWSVFGPADRYPEYFGFYCPYRK